MLKMYTTTWCSDCVITKQVLAKRGIAFEEINIEDAPEAADYVMRINGGKRSVPTLEYAGHAASLSGFSRAKLDTFLNDAGVLDDASVVGAAS
ncbi:MAG: glutaredoxin domain-containing protein [Deinococcota bacterium]